MTTTLTVTGMSCMNCVRHATEALEAVGGVTEVQVTLNPGQAIVTHAEATAPSVLIAALEEEGYTAAPV